MTPASHVVSNYAGWRWGEQTVFDSSYAHYFGTMHSWRSIQDRGVDTWVLVADYQVINPVYFSEP